MAQLHITNGNRKIPYSGILGSIWLGVASNIWFVLTPTPHHTTFFCARKTLRVFLIRRKKRHLPRTLCTIIINGGNV